MVRWTVPNELAKENTVSVIIAAYNEEACVIDTIESILSEDYPNLEVILVDDGSADHTAQKVIDHYGLEYSRRLMAKAPQSRGKKEYYEQSFHSGRLILIKKENGGKAESLNCGLDLCTGRYCVILDADTRIEKGSLRIMVSQFLVDKKTIVCAGAVGNNESMYQKLPFFRKCLVLFQTLEYYRTFYMQRILLDKLNANIDFNDHPTMLRISFSRHQITNDVQSVALPVINNVSTRKRRKISLFCAPWHRSIAMVRLRSASDEIESKI